MPDLKFKPVTHDHKAFVEKAKQREGFKKACENLEEEYALVKEMLTARARVGL